MDQILSLIERLTPRITSAALLLAVAAAVGPEDLGVYSVLMVAFTLFQATTDLASRNVIIRAIRSPQGRLWLHRFQLITGPVGVLLLACVLWIAGGGPENFDARFAVLFPACLTPAITASNLRNLASLQLHGRWRALASGQLFGAVASTSTSVPILLLGNPLLAAGMQLVLTEAFFAVWCHRSAARQPEPSEADGSRLTHDYAAMALQSGAGWAQSQSERLFMSLYAGHETLGLYSLASSISRAAADSLAASTANVLRASIARAGINVKMMADGLLLRALRLSAICYIATVSGSTLILAPLLGPEWKPAFQAVPIIAVVAFPACLSWTGPVLQLAAGNGYRAIIAPVSVLPLVPVIAFAAAHDLRLAAVAVVAKEVCVVTVGLLMVRDIAPWRAYRACLALTAVALIAAVALSLR